MFSLETQQEEMQQVFRVYDAYYDRTREQSREDQSVAAIFVQRAVCNGFALAVIYTTLCIIHVRLRIFPSRSSARRSISYSETKPPYDVLTACKNIARPWNYGSD